MRPTPATLFKLVVRLMCPIGLSLIAACSSSTDEQQIRGVIQRGETAAEHRDVGDAMALIADDYRDDQGFDKAQLRQFLRAYFFTHPKIELLVHIGDVQLETATRARVKVDVGMVGTRTATSGADTSLTGDRQRLRVELRKIDSNWLVSRIDRLE